MRMLIVILFTALAVSTNAQVKATPDGLISTSSSLPVLKPEWFASNIVRVQTITDRNNWPAEFRGEGLIMYVGDSLKHYTLKGGIENMNWTEFIPTTGGDGEPDGNKIDITKAGNSWIINNSAVTNAKISTGIDALKIGGGELNNTRLSYLGTISSNVQNQINSKQNTLVSGISLSTVNGQNLLLGGNILISSGTGSDKIPAYYE